MAIKEVFHFLLILGISSCVTSYICPPEEENIPGCKCEGDRNMLTLSCVGTETSNTIQDYRKILQENHFEHKRNVKLHFNHFYKESKLPSNVFKDFDITELKFFGVHDISTWADEEGGPAFVGLEDSLKTLSFSSVKYFSSEGERYGRETAPMSLGHLRKLRTVEFSITDIDTFGNGWFKDGPSSLEVLTLEHSKIRSISNRAFASLTNLKEIVIKYTNIDRVSRGMFPNPANNLKDIHLQANRLEDLPIDMFTNMPSLTTVELQYNPITRIPETVWRPVWSGLENLYFSYNTNSSLICDEQINWSFNVRPPSFLFAYCEEPEDMKGVSLRALIEEKQEE